MRKFILAAFAVGVIGVLCVSHKAQAIPLDLPYGTAIVATSSNTVTLTTATFTNTSYQWCIEQITVSPSAASTQFSVYYSTNNPPLNTATTGYAVTISTNYFFNVWPYRQPLCAPTNSIMTLQCSVAGSTIAYQVFTWKGWTQ